MNQHAAPALWPHRGEPPGHLPASWNSGLPASSKNCALTLSIHKDGIGGADSSRDSGIINLEDRPGARARSNPLSPLSMSSSAYGAAHRG